MDQQAPRDNRMYWVGEKTNLKSMDIALKHATSKHTVFSHQVLTSNEIKGHCRKKSVGSATTTSKKQTFKQKEEQNALLMSIWSDLNLPKS